MYIILSLQVINQEYMLSVKENESTATGAESVINPGSTQPGIWITEIGQVALSNNANDTHNGKNVDFYILDSHSYPL